jgi:hypothetical protein
MYARLISFSDADPDKRDRAEQTMRESVIPMLRQYDGFQGFVGLYDAGNRQARAVLLWENKEAAETAEETLAERRRGMAGGVGLTIDSTDLYEVLAVDLDRARG